MLSSERRISSDIMCRLPWLRWNIFFDSLTIMRSYIINLPTQLDQIIKAAALLSERPWYFIHAP